MAAPKYKLSCSLFGHTMDVRSVAVTNDGKIVSGSRDNTAKIWTPNESEIGFTESLTLSSHTNFVSCVCVMPATSIYPNGLIITGSNDKAIRLFDGTSASPLQTLNKHMSTVCKISVGVEENTIISSSWDKTAKLWNVASCQVIATFTEHEAAVWSVVQLSNGSVVTGSADKKIKVWLKSGSCLRTLTGHTDCVRDLAKIGTSEILSCSNDATVKHWNADSGLCLNTYYGHANFIYSINLVASDLEQFLTSSEDKTVKVWIQGEVADTIVVPACSVWSVASLPNGDVVTGSSDGIVRVFSSDPARQASPELLTAYQQEITALTTNANQVLGGIQVSNLPEKESLEESGSSDGQTKLIRENGGVCAYKWSAAEAVWVKIGDVVGAGAEAEGLSETGRQLFNGKEYDYVFSVDIEEGKPPLKLPYNKNEDPWFAAQKFIHDNHLNQQFLEQVANFIISNSDEQVSQISSANSDFVDPFTGSARYVPQGAHNSNHLVSNLSEEPDFQTDPLTGSSRYNPQSAQTPTNLSNLSNRSGLGTFLFFPQREFLRFDQANLNLILEKLLEFNKKTGDGNQMTSEWQIKQLVKMCEPGASCTPEDILVLDKLLKWPQEMVFPVLDVMRLAIRNQDVNMYLCTEQLLPSLMNFVAPGTGVPPNNMLALRVLSNMLSAEQGQILAFRSKVQLLRIIRDIPQPYTKPLQVAMATLLLNMSVVLRRAETPDGRAEALCTAREILPQLTEQEALFRALVALGTLLMDATDCRQYRNVLTPMLNAYLTDSKLSSKVQQCSQEILKLLQ